jgi:Zn-dependent protease
MFGLIATLGFLSAASEASGMQGVTGWLAIIPLVMISVLLHELGHYLGARLAGMKVLLMNVMGVECHLRRRGWLIRLGPKRNKRWEGHVYAVPDPARPMRAQMLLFAVMGPVFSALACMISMLIVLAASTEPLENGAAAFAVINGVMVIANLLPRTGRRYTDGASLLRWWRHKNDQDPTLANFRLTSYSMFGTTADALPEKDIQKIESDPMPVPLLAMWYRIKAAQNRADWADALHIGKRFEEALRTWGRPHYEFAALIAHIRAEVAFSSAMATGRHDMLSESLITKDLRQLCPYLWPRCLALKVFLDGALQEAEHLLRQAMNEANRSIDLALPKSEAMLARYIMDRAEQR